MILHTIQTREISKTVPSDRSFNAEGYYHPNGERHGASNVTRSYFIEEDPRLFDSGFFNIAPREAEATDPQQRLLLETVYEAMENAGLTLQGIRGSQTSVYCGAMSSDYMDVVTRDPENTSQYMVTGTSRALLANRLSYFFDWHGPSIAVDTACSSSLAAIHLGVQSLRNGEATMCCVAGSNLIMGPDVYLGSTSLHLLSASGRSQMWDNNADGYARGEGICALLMKPLSEALKYGDRIDAIIRETCINSDGRTKGIALPSADAQSILIRTAYKNAGLDILQAEDRPQYIEAHGTGTKAGDPLEARALSHTFFPPGDNHDDKPTILVGSIKTVIGHTEGTAGIAGVLKVILAMKHKTVPPNQHLHNLNPDVAPFYKKLRIPTSPQAWSTPATGHPLRASVNGFGLGGTNCHAIVESYVPEIHDNGPWGRSKPSPTTQVGFILSEDFTPTPLTFSAASESSLVALLEKYSYFLEKCTIPIHRVASTLNLHRSTFPVRVAIAGTSKKSVLELINKSLSKARGNSNVDIGHRAPLIDFNLKRHPRILGVFTGQGAQWPGMAQSLIEKCEMFRTTIENMEEALAQLPDPPAWSLKEEIMKSPTTSRLKDAEFSLPICAAVQVGLVQLLSRAGITFHTVVGHSGGEIGAAYAAGYISKVDAVKIAYYRGIVCKLAVSPDGSRGSMIAVGFGYQEGLDFCATYQMQGRLTVAASNSPKSVTLAGDKDAVFEAKQILDKQGMFNRVLQVDTGYHSHHMIPCAEPYTEQLKGCNIEVGKGNGFTNWVSSVYTDSRTISRDEDADIKDRYWTDNLIGRVLFSQALERALDDERGTPDMILEVGPHPALRGPSLETVRKRLGFEVPYCGVLDRKLDDIAAFSNALGSVWANLGPACVDFDAYTAAFTNSKNVTSMPPLADLPTYAWDHKQILWRESRINKQVRSRIDPPHELLGARTPDDTEYEPRWRNFLKLDEMPWLKNHRIQNQILVPAAAYVVFALEAAKVLGRGRNVKCIELLNIAIMRPIVLDEASEGTETLLSLRSDLDSSKGRGDIIRADFSLSAGAMEVGIMKTAATGEIHIHLESSQSDASFFRKKHKQTDVELLPVNVNQFYASLEKIGLNYSGPFKTLMSLARRMDMASAVIALDKDVGTSIPIHPTWLDVCFQTFLAAFAAPRDDSLWTAFMPTTIGSIRFHPEPDITPHSSASVDARLHDFTPGYLATLPTMTGDLKIYNSESGQMVVSVEDFTMSSFIPALERDDKLLYLKTVWQQDILSGVTFETDDMNSSQEELELIDACEAAVQFYLNRLYQDEFFNEKTLERPYLKNLVARARARDLSTPGETEITSILTKFGKNIDMILIKTLSEMLQLQQPIENGVNLATPVSLTKLITQWHHEGIGSRQLQKHFTHAVRQLSHKHATLRILQIGPSSINLVQAVCQELEHTLGTYTIVDKSAEMIQEMESHVTDQPRVAFQTFDVENGQGESPEGVFDVVIIHKFFQDQDSVLKKVRGLLKPGGYLIMLAATGHQLRFPFFAASSLPSSQEEDVPNRQKNSSRIGQEIHEALQSTGFSGVDSIALDSIPEKHTFSVVVSQAIDDRVSFLRAPTTAKSIIDTNGKILILGGLSVNTKQYLRAIQSKLSKVWSGMIAIVESLAELKNADLDRVTATLSLTELDQAVLANLTAHSFKNLQLLLTISKTTLWVTKGATSENPHHSATLGLYRTLQSENAQKNLQILDLDTQSDDGSIIADTLLRLIAGATFSGEEKALWPLWTFEEEIVVEGGKYFIPRVFLDQERNDRLNAFRRKVEREALAGITTVTLCQSHQGDGGNVYATLAIPNTQSILRGANNQVQLKVQYCSIEPAVPNFNGAQLFLCIGHTVEGTQMLALTSSHSSSVTVPSDWTVAVGHTESKSGDDLEVFILTLSEVKSRLIASCMPTGCVTLLDNVDPYLAAALAKLDTMTNKSFALINPRNIANLSYYRCIDLEVQASKKSLRASIPKGTRLVVNLKMGDEAYKSSLLRQILPKSVTTIAYHEIESPSDIILSKLLSDSFRSGRESMSSMKIPFDSSIVVPASSLLDGGIKNHPHVMVVDWTKQQTLKLTSTPIETRGLFSPKKTYILFGLTGDIGQSICRWMVSNGARHIVVTSRNPDKSATWKDGLLMRGAKIVIEATDVTRKQDVLDLRGRILKNMPPIGGVANGAMVQANSLLADMTFDDFQSVMGPKVDGSINLDDVFSGDDLEFFLLFSSISAVTGQQGQANYAAANQFMVGLASQRRARGLPASVIDIGMVTGLGFVSRTDIDGSLESLLHGLDYMPISERDLHHLLAEAVLVDKIQDTPEIITGLHVYDTGHSPFWHKKARFSHLISKAETQKVQISTTHVQKSLKERLNEAHGAPEAQRIMEEALSKYLASSLKLDPANIYTDVPVIDLGIDSLVAVEIRNYIFAETTHDVPILKILGGSTIKQMCAEVVANLSPVPGQSARTADMQTSAVPAPATPQKTVQNKLPNGNSKVLQSLNTSQTTKVLQNGHATTSTPPVYQHVASTTAPSSKQAIAGDPIRSAPLSLGQSRLWFLSQYLEDNTALNCTMSYEFSGKIDVVKLQKSIEAVIKRHETLRTGFRTNDYNDTPVQEIFASKPFKLRVLPNFCSSAQVEQELEQVREYRYNLGIGDTFVATILHHSDKLHTIIFGYHHIIMDGVSWQILLRDLAHFYDNAMARMTAKPLPEQYIDFTLKQQQAIVNGKYQESLRFFENEFQGPLVPLPLFPFARVSTRKAPMQYKVRDVITHVNADVVSALRNTARNTQATSFHFFLSAFQVLLHRFLHVERICIGMVDANRSSQTFKDVVGFFLETIPILFHIDSTKTFDEVIQATRNKVYASFARTGTPTEEILRSCNVPSTTTETPLFQVCFNYRMGAGRTPSMKNVDVKFKSYSDAQHPFDLVVSVDELDDGTAMLTFSLQDYLYDNEGAQLLMKTYVRLLGILAQNTSTSVQDIPIFDSAWSQESVVLGTGPPLGLTPCTDNTLSKIVDTWARAEPNHLAVKDKYGGTMTYAQMIARATSISNTLLSNDGVSMSPVAVLLDPSMHTIATMLGILRVGSTYVPLDVRNTDEVLVSILAESGSQVLVYHLETEDRAKRIKVAATNESLRLVKLHTVSLEDTNEAEDKSIPDGVAMILYTSGSTGKPKGIPLTNTNLRSTILGVSQVASLGREVVLQQSGQGFDAAIYQIFNALANGGTLVMADNRDHPADIAALMARESVTCTTFIFSEMRAMLNYGYEELRKCSSWRIAMVAGELFTNTLLKQFRALNQDGLKIINAYGPTEASICNAMHEIVFNDYDNSEAIIPIGKAIPDHSVYIVDEECKPVPIGWPGEIVVCGPGVASGYLNQPNLSKERFKQLLSVGHVSRLERTYRTGDRGRMRSDGSIVMLSRVDGDDQVKIRGMRVHLKDVSQAIIQSSQGNLVDAATILRGNDSGTQHLIAFALFSKTSQILDKQTYLRQLCLGLPIPTHMRPVAIVSLENLPFTVRGKLDTRNLASLDLPDTYREVTPDEELTEQETRLRDVWLSVLGDVSIYTPINRNSEFFSVGGNSLLLLQLKSEIYRAFGEDIALPELFQASTLELQAARLSSTAKVSELNWEAETDLGEKFYERSRFVNGHPSQERRTEGLSVVLTGATGYLGSAILRKLIEDPRFNIVHCVAIRNDSNGEPRKLSIQSPKIVCYAGDLTLPDLGMDQAQKERLFSNVDVVIHNGAEVSHMKNYRSLRAANVLSTIEIARLAVRNRAPLHYISTGGVARLSGASSQPESSLAAYQPPIDGSDGYVASKWASEVILEKVSNHFNLPVWIHRPSSITGGNIPALDIVHSLLQYSRLMKAIPDLAGSTGALDFVYVDTVSKGIAACAAGEQKTGEDNEKNIIYMHHCGNEIVPLDRLKEHLEGQATGSFSTLALQDWVDGALKIGLDEVVGSFMLASKGVIKAPLLEKAR
ncbi:putative hybrid NRPS/PKS enzyme [Phaeosphaeriaceae sp. PMI808]|nr:putative hybrid NRPS/PKS enzyme [Phaeosphaeriaceae sp. PMI808]